MIADCEATGGEFGIVYSAGTRAGVGTGLVIDEILERTEDGRTNLIARGTRRFEIKATIPGSENEGEGKLYDRAEVTWVQDTSDDWDEAMATEAFARHPIQEQGFRPRLSTSRMRYDEESGSRP